MDTPVTSTLLRRLAHPFALCLLLAACIAAPAGAQDHAAEHPAAAALVPTEEAVARGSDSPRNAAYTFVVLARDGEWADAADMLQRPESSDRQRGGA